MSMRKIDLDDPTVASVTILGDVVDSTDDNVDLLAHLRVGRVLGFTAFTLRNIERLMSSDHLAWFVSPGMLVVNQLTDDVILGAVRDAVALGLGVVQRED
ncbi:MAG TPA: hypothetical protein VFF31_11140 [Blastocatellia bacterium]|nr:hypothetical protein [Blastocatellia bacterium]